jgi:hypothetical protein
MDSGSHSLELLSHFDRAADATASVVRLKPSAGFEPRRGTGWVLKWFAALAVFFYSTTVLLEFAYCVAAEQLLLRAARAGVLEATLPRATVRSVEQSVWRRLEGRVGSRGEVRLMLLDNGVPVGKKLRPQGGDRLSLSLAMPPRAMMPGWLRTLSGWRCGAIVETRADGVMPGRKVLAGSY